MDFNWKGKERLNKKITFEMELLDWDRGHAHGGNSE